MDRDELREQFSPLLDGELTANERAAFEEALAQDADALRELERLKRVNALYGQLPRQHAPEDLEERVHAELGRGKVVRFRGRIQRKAVWPLLAAAALFAVVIGGVVIQYSYLETAGRSFDLAKHAETAAEEAAAPQAAVSVDEDRSASAPWSDQAEKPAPSRDMPRARTEEGMARRVTPETPPQAAAPAKPLRRAAAEVKDARRARSRLRRDEDVPAYAADKILGEGATDRPTEEPPALTDDIEYAQLDLLQEGQPSRDRAPSPSRRRREREDLGAAAPDEETAGESTREAEGDTAFKAGRAAPIVAAEKEREVRRTVGDRVFELEDGVWRQAGYAEEEAVILTRTAGELGELAEEFPDLREILEWQEGVVFEVGDKWYRLEPRP